MRAMVKVTIYHMPTNIMFVPSVNFKISPCNFFCLKICVKWKTLEGAENMKDLYFNCNQYVFHWQPSFSLYDKYKFPKGSFSISFNNLIILIILYIKSNIMCMPHR